MINAGGDVSWNPETGEANFTVNGKTMTLSSAENGNRLQNGHFVGDSDELDAFFGIGKPGGDNSGSLASDPLAQELAEFIPPDVWDDMAEAIMAQNPGMTRGEANAAVRGVMGLVATNPAVLRILVNELYYSTPEIYSYIAREIAPKVPFPTINGLSAEANVYLTYYAHQFSKAYNIQENASNKIEAITGWLGMLNAQINMRDIVLRDESGTIGGKVHNVPLYKQGNLNLCWTFSYVMVEDYHNGKVRRYGSGDAENNKRAIDLAISSAIAKGYVIATGEEISKALWNQGGNPGTKNIIDAGHNALTSKLLAAIGTAPLYAVYSYFDEYGERHGHAIVTTGVVSTNGHPTLVSTNNPWGVSGVQTIDDFISGLASSGSKYKLESVSEFTFVELSMKGW